MIRTLNAPFIPNKVVLFRPSDQESIEIDTVSPFIKNQDSLQGKATAYVCLNHACLKPTTSIKEMMDMLK